LKHKGGQERQSSIIAEWGVGLLTTSLIVMEYTLEGFAGLDFGKQSLPDGRVHGVGYMELGHRDVHGNEYSGVAGPDGKRIGRSYRPGCQQAVFARQESQWRWIDMKLVTEACVATSTALVDGPTEPLAKERGMRQFVI